MKSRLVAIASLILALASPALFAKPAVLLDEQESAIAQKYLQLRNDYTKSVTYNPYEKNTALLNAAHELFEQGKYDETLKTIEPALLKNPYSVRFLPVKISALRKLGKTAEAETTLNTYKGVIDSILISGDGRTASTAMHVIDTAEEYCILDVLGMKFIKQSLVQDDGHSYDVMTASFIRDTSQPPKTFDVYFNIDRPLSWLNKSDSENRAPPPAAPDVKEKSHEQ